MTYMYVTCTCMYFMVQRVLVVMCLHRESTSTGGTCVLHVNKFYVVFYATYRVHTTTLTWYFFCSIWWCALPCSFLGSCWILVWQWQWQWQLYNVHQGTKGTYLFYLWTLIWQTTWTAERHTTTPDNNVCMYPVCVKKKNLKNTVT